MVEKMDYFKELEKEKNIGYCHQCNTNWASWKEIQVCPFCKSSRVEARKSA